MRRAHQSYQHEPVVALYGRALARADRHARHRRHGTHELSAAHSTARPGQIGRTAITCPVPILHCYVATRSTDLRAVPQSAIVSMAHRAAYSEDLAGVLCSAMNDWLSKEWLDAEPRLRASIIVPIQNVEMAVKEIEKRACDPRFVQILMLVAGEKPLGSRMFWPIYEGSAAAFAANRAACRQPVPPRTKPDGLGFLSRRGLRQLCFRISGADAEFHPRRRFRKISVATPGADGIGVHMDAPPSCGVSKKHGMPYVPKSPGWIARLLKLSATMSGLQFSRMILRRQPQISKRSSIKSTRIESYCFRRTIPHWQFEGYDALPPGNVFRNSRVKYASITRTKRILA